MRSLAEWCEYVKEWREGKGFRTPSSIEEDELMLGKLMLVVTEISEAAEAVRHHDMDNFREEIADTFIRLFDICGTMDLDIEWDIEAKMLTNTQRPHQHGKESSV